MIKNINALKNIKSYSVILGFLLFFVLLGAGLPAFHVFAAEVKYPSLPGLPDLNAKNVPLESYAEYICGFLIYIAGILSLISFVVGALGLIAAIDNPESASNGKDRMKGSIIGLVLTVSAFIILQTINPLFISTTLTPLPGVQGVYYYNGTDERSVSWQVTDVSQQQAVKDGYNQLKYDCVKGQESNSPNLLIWEFPEPGLDTGNSNRLGNTSVTVADIKCGGIEPVPKGSFRMAFETPGIYFYLGTGCKGYSSGAMTSSSDSIDAPFNGQVGSIRIVNNPAGNISYGVIFHEQVLGKGGYCTDPIFSSGTGGCKEVSDYGDIDMSAVDIFTMTDSVSAGTEVNFYSEPYGWNVGENAGCFSVTNEPGQDTCKNNVSFGGKQYQGDPSEMCFDYTGVNQPLEYRCRLGNKCGNSPASCDPASGSSSCGMDETCDPQNKVCVNQKSNSKCSPTGCSTFQDCPGSIQINGTYLVGLYSAPNKNGQEYCQTFKGDVENLNAQPFKASGQKLKKIEIIPVQQ